MYPVYCFVCYCGICIPVLHHLMSSVLIADPIMSLLPLGMSHVHGFDVEEGVVIPVLTARSIFNRTPKT